MVFHVPKWLTRHPLWQWSLTPVSLAFAYVLGGILWILYSDQWLLQLVPDVSNLSGWQTGKGLLYVGATGYLLYRLLRRNQRAMALQRRTSYSQALIENASDLIVTLSADGVFRYCSPSMERILGYLPTQLIGQPVTGFTHSDDWPRVSQTLAQALQSPNVSQPLVGFRLWHHDGSWHPFEAIVTNLLFHPAIQGIVVNCRDVSDRNQAELALRASEYQFRQAVLNAPYPMIIHAEDGQVVQINQTWTEITGYTLADIPTMADWTEKAYGLRKDLVRADIDQLYQLDRRIEEGEYTLTTARGETRIWDFSSAPLGPCSDGRRMVISMATDVTERKQAEQQLKQAEQVLEQRVQERTLELETANRELDAFSYSVSHDLRAPLRHIGGFVNVLAQALMAKGELNDPQILHYLEVIRESSQRMGLLIDGLLNLSRVGRKPLVQAPVEVRSLVEQAIALVTSQLSSEVGDRLRITLHSLPTVTGDAVLLQQVFTNLIDNAIKFSRTQPSPSIVIGTTDTNTLFIRDNGVGFCMDYADQLFGAFQRLHPRSEFEGMGIGLAIVQRIIHRHGGEIWVESAPGQGTTFYLHLTPLPIQET